MQSAEMKQGPLKTDPTARMLHYKGALWGTGHPVTVKEEAKDTKEIEAVKSLIYYVG